MVFLRLQQKLANCCQILPKYSYQFQPWVFDGALQQNVWAWFVQLQFLVCTAAVIVSYLLF